jgi:hypothetical protein
VRWVARIAGRYEKEGMGPRHQSGIIILEDNPSISTFLKSDTAFSNVADHHGGPGSFRGRKDSWHTPYSPTSGALCMRNQTAPITQTRTRDAVRNDGAHSIIA